MFVFEPVHFETICSHLRRGTRVYFDYHDAYWNQERQCGSFHARFPTENPMFQRYYYGWENFVKVLKSSICNNGYRV